MPTIKKQLLKKTIVKKPLKTIEENSKWKNLKTIDTKIKKVIKNIDLIKLVESWKLSTHEVIKPNGKEKYVRAIKNNTKKDNLDPKIVINKPKKIGNKKIIKTPKKLK